MNKKIKGFIKNFSYSLLSNLISLIISVLVMLIVPKFIGIEEFGYWQLYLLYSSYVGFLHFGWNDGIYLRYGGKKYEDLNKSLFFSQFWMLFLFQLLILILILIMSNTLVLNDEKLLIMEMTALCMFIVNLRYMFGYILQGTNRIKEYASIILIERILFMVLVIFVLLAGQINYNLLILTDLIGKFFSLMLAIYYCHDIVFRNIKTFYFDLIETLENIKAGIKLMFAGIASLLIIGVFRFGIEYSWDVSTFGKISLTLSISNFLMIFVNAVGLVTYPILRRTDRKELAKIYLTIRDFISVILLGALFFYYPLKMILSSWIPAYQDSLIFMAFLFPMVVFEGKMALLFSTYLKTLRKEKMLLIINLLTLSLSIISAVLSTIVLRNLTLAILSIVLALAFRSILADIYLSKNLKLIVFKDILLEIILTLIFILTGWYMDSWTSSLYYGLVFFIYLIIKKKDLINSYKYIRTITHK